MWEKEQNIFYLWTEKRFIHPSLYPLSLETKFKNLGWGEIEALKLFYYGRRGNRRRFNKAGLNSPPVTDIRSRKRLHLRWWLLTPHLTRKNSPNNSCCCWPSCGCREPLKADPRHFWSSGDACETLESVFISFSEGIKVSKRLGVTQLVFAVM